MTEERRRETDKKALAIVIILISFAIALSTYMLITLLS
jgi:hypothetical protein